MQLSFTSAQFSSKKKQTRRDRLLTALEQLAPWSALEAVIEPHYPKTDGKGGAIQPRAIPHAAYVCVAAVFRRGYGRCHL